MIDVVNVSSRGQIVIPQSVRKRLDIKKGSRLALLEKEGAIILKKEDELLKKIEGDEMKEELGWLAVAEQSLRELWDNPKDEKVWKRYLNE